jgi:hypothetical protein
MKKNKNIVFTFIAVVLVQFLALAQEDPGDFGGGDNPIDTPIDAYVLLLLVVGLVYVFYKYRSLKSKESLV